MYFFDLKDGAAFTIARWFRLPRRVRTGRRQPPEQKQSKVDLYRSRDAATCSGLVPRVAVGIARGIVGIVGGVPVLEVELLLQGRIFLL